MKRKKYLDRIRQRAIRFIGKELYNVYRKMGWSVEKIYYDATPEFMVSQSNIIDKTWLLLKKYSNGTWGIYEQTKNSVNKFKYQADVIIELETGKIVKNRFGKISN